MSEDSDGRTDDRPDEGDQHQPADRPGTAAGSGDETAADQSGDTAVAPGDDVAVDGDGAPSGRDAGDEGGVETEGSAGTEESTAADEDLEELRRRVEERYDFDDFGPADMAEMSPEEWEAAFDADTWITGTELLDRVEADLKQRVANRDVFARIERLEDRLIAYSDTGYAVVHPDGSVEGRGTVLRDVKPTVALCSMESYDVPEEPPEGSLPDPAQVPQGSGDFGNRMLQVVAAVQVLAGIGLFAASLLVVTNVIRPSGPSGSLNVFAMIAAGAVFVFLGIVLFTVVANARLSDKFRAEEYRNRLRAVDLEEGELPEFLSEDGEGDLDGEAAPPVERLLSREDDDTDAL